MLVTDSRSNNKFYQDRLCRLCGGETEQYFRSRWRTYCRCRRCSYIQVAVQYLPDEETEKQRYLLHNNDPQASGYVKYLTRFCERTVFEHLAPGSRLLELGSGPNPVLAGILRDAGYQVRIYDPHFADDPSVFHDHYDGAVAVEVIEHLRDPAQFLDRVSAVLKPGGFVFLRTELWEGSSSEFAGWWYKEDITHVGFYCRKAIGYVARALSGQVESIDNGTSITIRKVRSGRYDA